MPVPTMPRVNSSALDGPASGRNAAAACAAVCTSVLPAACNVAPVVRMMKYMTRFEKKVPMPMWWRARNSAASTAK